MSIPTTATQVRFYFMSDGSVTATGAYIDDVVLTATGSATPTLAISSNTWSPTSAAQTSSAINVTNSGTSSVIAYTVSSNQTWLTVSAASGNTPGSFTMTAAANTGAARTATVTVTATTAGVAGSPKTIAVSQAAPTGTQNDAGTGADAGNDFASATLVSPGSWTGCYLDATDRNDYYKFNVTSGQVVKVKVTPPSSADYDLYLYNPSQTQVGSSTAGTGVIDSVVYTATVSGTFYAKAYEYSGTGNYSLLISVSGGSSTPTLAISTTSWSPTSAAQTSSAVNVTNSTTSDVIAYTVSSNATSWLTVSAASGNTPGSFTMTTTANTGTARTGTVTVAASGQTSKTVTVTQAAPAGADTYEPNGTVAQAYAITSGTAYNSYIYSNGDIDYYSLNVTMAGAITVNLTNLPGDYDLYLYSTDGTTQLGSSTNSSTTAEAINYTATAAGTYYVKVIGYNGAYSTTVAYALTATYPTGAPTPTLAISQTTWAPAAAGGTSSAVNVTNSGSSSVIAYTVSSNQTWLTVSSASGNTPGSFTMTAANNTGSARSATVTVTSTTGGVANSPQTITVNQPAPGGSAYEWTIMVYLNADNSLDSYGDVNYNQMTAASQSSGKYRVVVQYDHASGNSNFTDCKRFLVTPGKSATTANQLSDLGEVDMGSPTTLSTFANWAIDNYPANHYFLVMWDHGGGWTKKGAKDVGVFKDFSNDDQSGNSIGIANGEFATAMSAIKSHLGRNLDAVGWDCCLMGMEEVMDIARNYADAAFGSEETEAGTGWNYTPFLNAINSNPTISNLELIKALIIGTGSSGLDTQADIDLTKVAALNTAVSTFADQLMSAKAAGYTSAIHTCESATQAFYLTENRDLYDFANRISTASVPAALQTAAANVKTAVTNCVYYNLHSSSFSGANGMAI
ncbi:MAG TPA: clostripain-related cysteine peptidase, partial [Candidatus Edwardsbacteria bacterium]|nr:clostripain-related cysteine peptidase [Candidatus Edwardsbacteria bacterium]